MKQKKCSKRIFFFAVVLLWLFTAAVGMEAVARLIAARRLEAAQRVAAQLYSARETVYWNQKTLARFADTPPATGTDFEARLAFLAGEEEVRRQYIADRGDLVLLLSAERVLAQLYGPSADAAPEIRHMAEQLRPGLCLTAVLPRQLHYDVEQALNATFAGQRQMRDYPMPQPDGAEYVMQFVFMPMPDTASRTAAAAVFIRPSMWQVLWFSFKPNIHQNDMFDFRTNAQGFRDEEICVPKPPGRFRIVCFGGSSTAEGPTNQLTYPKMLDAMLKDRYGEDRIEVLNCGIFAILSQNEAERFQDIIALEPDLIVYYNFVNDLLLLFEAFPAWGRRLRQSAFVYNHLNPLLLPGDHELEQAIRRATLDNLQHMHDLADAAGVPMAFCSFAAPDFFNIPPDERAFFDKHINGMAWGRKINMRSYLRITDTYNRLLKAQCREWGALYIPTAETLTGGAAMFTDICHLHLWGIERKAVIVFEHLVPWLNLHLPLAKW